MGLANERGVYNVTPYLIGWAHTQNDPWVEMTRTSCTTALMVQVMCTTINTLRPRQNGRYSPDNIFKYIFLNENVWIAIKISLKFVPKGPIYNIPVLGQIMAWRQRSDKPLSTPMMVILLMHICVIWPQWVNWLFIDHGPLARYAKLRVRMRRECRERFPRHRR